MDPIDPPGSYTFSVQPSNPGYARNATEYRLRAAAAPPMPAFGEAPLTPGPQGVGAFLSKSLLTLS